MCHFTSLTQTSKKERINNYSILLTEQRVPVIPQSTIDHISEQVISSYVCWCSFSRNWVLIMKSFLKTWILNCKTLRIISDSNTHNSYKNSYESIESSSSQLITLLPSLMSTFLFSTVRIVERFGSERNFHVLETHFSMNCRELDHRSLFGLILQREKVKWIMKKSDSKENRKRNFFRSCMGKFPSL